MMDLDLTCYSMVRYTLYHTNDISNAGPVSLTTIVHAEYFLINISHSVFSLLNVEMNSQHISFPTVYQINGLQSITTDRNLLTDSLTRERTK